jgi:hypothetical protein
MAKVYPVPNEINVPSNIIDDTQYDFEALAGENDSGKSFVLPTGNELMSRPIKTGGESRAEKEIDFVITTVRTKLDTLYKDQLFETGKLKFFLIALTSAFVGLILIFFGFGMTVLFDSYKDKDPNYIAIAFGGLFFTPMLWFFSYLCFPNKQQFTVRKKIKKDRRERRKPTLFNKMVDDAKKATEPPPRLIKVVARFRKQDFIIIGSTWKDFCEEFERQTSLPIERQLIRFNDEDLQIDLTKNLDKDYGLDNFSKVFVYNRGGLFTKQDPRRKQYEEIQDKETAKLNEMKAVYEKQQYEDNSGGREKFMSLMKKVSGGAEQPPGKKGGGRGTSREGRRSSSEDRMGRGSSSLTEPNKKESFVHSKGGKSKASSGGGGGSRFSVQSEDSGSDGESLGRGSFNV